jgi:hypothetical protein
MRRKLEITQNRRQWRRGRRQVRWRSRHKGQLGGSKVLQRINTMHKETRLVQHAERGGGERERKRPNVQNTKADGFDREQWKALLKTYLRKKIQPTCKNCSVVTQQKLKLRIEGVGWGGGRGDVIMQTVTDYEACPESIQPFWTSREPVVWPWCNLAASQRRPYCASVNSHSPVGLVSR